MSSSKLIWKKIELVADARQRLDEQGFKPVNTEHLSFEHADCNTAILYLPEVESAN